MDFNLAQINIAKMLGPIDSRVMQEFVANLDRINRVAENSPGFIWRLVEENNNATSIKVFDDEFIIVNMSVWSSVETLSDYVYKSDHASIFKRRKSGLKKCRRCTWHYGILRKIHHRWTD